MLRIYLLQAIRSLKSQKVHVLVILLGLIVSMASAFLIYSYVFFERSYDSFHQAGKNLYRVIVDAQSKGEDAYVSPYSFSAQGPMALAEVPEVEAFTRLVAMPSMVVSSENGGQNNQMLTINEYYFADDNFFEIFSFPLIYGFAKQALKNKGSVVISKSIAEKLFGNENPIGKNILLDGKHINTVTGVMEDIPENTHLKFEMIFPMKNIPWILNPKNEWTNHSFFSYLLLKDGANPDLVEKKISESYKKENRAINQMECVWHLQRIDDAYLKTSDFTSKPGVFKFGDPRMVYFLSIIIVLLLSVSWVNYINLLTAKNNERLDEVKVRKVNGASKGNLIIQFFIESSVLNLSGLILACIIVILSIHSFSQFMSFPVEVISKPSFWTIPLIVVAASIFLPGLYTAFSLSQKKLDKDLTPVSRYTIRDGMVILQFIIIIALASSILFIDRQLNYISSIEVGFKKEQILVLNIPRISEKNIDNQDFETFRSELTRIPEIIDVSATTSVPGRRFGGGNGSPHIEGQQNENTYFRVGRVFKNYPALMNFKFVAGQSFDNSDSKMVINEAAVEEFGFTNPTEILNRRVTWMGYEFTIAGVTENFHQESLHILPEPMIMYTKEVENTFNYILINLSEGDVQNLLKKIEHEFKTQFPGNPFTFFFLDKYFDRQYQKDIKFRALFSFFSIIALIIGYFGLYGLTTYTIIKRRKEIGIRKVNGAKISEVLVMLNKDLVKWVAIAFVIATPIAYYAMNKWLQNFAYKTNLSWWIFAVAGLLALGIALLTVSVQSWKAATRNPVEALRYE